MSFYQAMAADTGIKSCHDLSQSEYGKVMICCWWAICRQRPGNRKRICLYYASKTRQEANIIVNPKVLAGSSPFDHADFFMAVKGKLQLEEGGRQHTC